MIKGIICSRKKVLELCHIDRRRVCSSHRPILKNSNSVMDRKKETTTLAVHRCRFVDYAPSAITALAYPPLPLPSVKGKKKTTAGKQPLRFGLLAVGHANGNIDICEWMGAERESQCSQAWVVRKVSKLPMYNLSSNVVYLMTNFSDTSWSISIKSRLFGICHTASRRSWTRCCPRPSKSSLIQFWWRQRTNRMGSRPRVYTGE